MLSSPAEGPKILILFWAVQAQHRWHEPGDNTKSLQSHRGHLLLQCVVLCGARAGKLGKKLFYLIFVMELEMLAYCFLLELPW